MYITFIAKGTPKQMSILKSISLPNQETVRMEETVTLQETVRMEETVRLQETVQLQLEEIQLLVERVTKHQRALVLCQQEKVELEEQNSILLTMIQQQQSLITDSLRKKTMTNTLG